MYEYVCTCVYEYVCMETRMALGKVSKCTANYIRDHGITGPRDSAYAECTQGY